MKVKLIPCLIFLILSIVLFGYTVTKAEETTGLRISNIVFCSERPTGYMAYTEQPDATYKPGDVVWIYLNLDDVKYNPNPDESKEMWIKLYLKLKAPDGAILMDQELYNEHKNFEKKYNMDEIFLRVNINTIPQLDDGKYIVELNLEDKLAGATAFASSSFHLKK